MANTYELIVKTVDRSTRPLANIEKSLAKLESRSKAVNRTLAGVGAALVAVVSARGLKAVVDVTSRFEDLQTSLSTVTGSAQEGARAFEFVQRFASETAFSVEQLTQTYIKLQGAGITPTEKLLRTFSDAVSTSTDRLGALEAITDLFARTTAGGLGLEDLNRLADRGIPVFDILQKKLGLTRLQISEVGKTAEGAKSILDALVEGLNERFGGATERTLGNLSVLVSNLGDAVDRALAAFGRGLSPALKGVIEGLTGFVNVNEDLFFQLGQGAGETLKLLSTGITKLASSLGALDAGGLQKVFGALTVGFGKFLAGLDTSINTLLNGFAQINNAIVKTQAVIGDGIVLDPGQTAEDEVVRLKNKLEELQNIDFKQLIALGPTAFAAAWTATQVEVSRVESQIEALENGTAPVLQLMETGFNRTGGAINDAADNIIKLGEEMQAAGEKAAEMVNLDLMVEQLQGYDDAIMRIARSNEAFAETQRKAAENARLLQQSLENQVMSMQVVPATLSETNAAFSELIQNTNETIAQQELNDELVRRVTQSYKDGYISLEQYNVAIQKLGISINDVTDDLSGFEQFMETTIETAKSSVNQTSYATQAQAALKQQLADGKITLDVYSAAMERVNGILGVNKTAASGASEAIATVSSTYKDATQAIEDFNLKQTNVAGAMSRLENDFANGKISLQEFRVGMESMGAGMDNIQNRSIAMGLTITDAFTQAGDSLASGLARGIVRGEGIMNSFKNFMSSILETILTQIIQQAFINPMIASMTQGFSQAFSAFGAGGSFGSGMGLLGSLFGGGGGLFGMLGGLFFANGGVVPGLPTSGDSVPAMLTPGEVILNKRQQAEVLQGGGDEPVTVNFNINAIDTQTGTEFILQNKKQITSVIQQAYNTRGQSGPLG